MSDDRFREMAIAHLLRELDGREEASFAAELMRRGEPGHGILREIQEPLGDLALAVEPAEPPASLRARVLSDVAPPAPREIRPERPRSPWPWLVALVLCLSALALGLWSARLAAERGRLREAVVRLEDRVATAESVAARTAELEQEVALIRGPGTAVRHLVGTPALPAAAGRAFVDTVGGRLLLYASGLTATGSDSLYALWAIGPEGPRAAGAFRSDVEGRARHQHEDPERWRDVQALTVTVEPAEGVERPTGPSILISEPF